MSVIDHLRRARARLNTNGELGRLLGLSGEEVGRVLKGGRGVSAEVALRLALANDEDHLALLEAAGHRHLAELLRRIYEPAAGRRRLSIRDQHTLDDLRALSDHDRRLVLELIKTLAKK